jgi:hypothetical protein
LAATISVCSSCGLTGHQIRTRCSPEFFNNAKAKGARRSEFAHVPAPFAKFNHKFLGDGLGLFSVKRGGTQLAG